MTYSPKLPPNQPGTSLSDRTSFDLNPLSGQVTLGQGQGGGGPTIYSESLAKIFTASENIPALSLVYIYSDGTIRKGQTTTSAQALVVGVTSASVAAGGAVLVQLFGELDNPAFTFSPNLSLFLNNNGVISATPPTTGFLMPIGQSLSVGSIFINIGKVTALG
jgi:hypothetical protein